MDEPLICAVNNAHHQSASAAQTADWLVLCVCKCDRGDEKDLWFCMSAVNLCLFHHWGGLACSGISTLYLWYIVGTGRWEWIQPSYRHQSFVHLSWFFIMFCNSLPWQNTVDGGWKSWYLLKFDGDVCVQICIFASDTDYDLWKIVQWSPHHPPSYTSCHSSVSSMSFSLHSSFTLLQQLRG